MYITKTITITVHATADDWQLYDLPGREDAAIALNQRFEELVNKGAKRSDVRNGMRLSDYANLGAGDTEVRYFVVDLLDGHSVMIRPMYEMEISRRYTRRNDRASPFVSNHRLGIPNRLAMYGRKGSHPNRRCRVAAPPAHGRCIAGQCAHPLGEERLYPHASPPLCL